MKFKSALICGVLLCSSTVWAADVKPAADDANVKLARAFEQHILKQEGPAAEPMIDGGALIDRCEAGISAPKDLAAGFKDGASDINKSEVAVLMQQVAAGGHYVFVRVRLRAGKPVALFRMQSADDTVDYHEWYIEPDANGTLRFVDAYDVAKGELMSQTLRRIYLAAVISQDKGKGAQFGAKEAAFVDSITQIKQMNEAARAGEFQKVIDIYNTLPASVQKDKSVMVIRVTASFQLPGANSTEYEKAIGDFEKAFPNDPAIDLLGLAHLVSAKQYLAAHQAVDRLIAFTGGDAHLECLHAQIYAAAGQPADLASAVTSYKKAVVAEPDNSEGYWGLVTMYLEQKDYPSTAAELTEIENKLHLELKDLNSVPLYAGFVKSPDYKKWLAGHSKSAPAKSAPAK